MANKQTKTYTCDRCGMDIYLQHRSTHTERCNALPTPVELAERLLRDPEAKVTVMARELQGYTSRSFTDRVNFGLMQMGHPPASALAAGRRDFRPGFSDDEGKKRPCPKCGMFFSRLDLHEDRCDRLPLPVELAREFLDGRLSLVDLVEKYGGEVVGSNGSRAGTTGLRDRLWHGLVKLGVYQTPQVLSVLHRRQRAEEEEARIAAIRDSMVPCRLCQIDLHAAPPGRDGLCGWCAEPALEVSRAGDGAYQAFEVNGTVVLLSKKQSPTAVVPFMDVVTAVDRRMALRGAETRLKAEHGEGWRWQSQPVVNE